MSTFKNMFIALPGTKIKSISRLILFSSALVTQFALGSEAYDSAYEKFRTSTRPIDPFFFGEMPAGYRIFKSKCYSPSTEHSVHDNISFRSVGQEDREKLLIQEHGRCGVHNLVQDCRWAELNFSVDPDKVVSSISEKEVRSRNNPSGGAIVVRKGSDGKFWYGDSSKARICSFSYPNEFRVGPYGYVVDPSVDYSSPNF